MRCTAECSSIIVSVVAECNCSVNIFDDVFVTEARACSRDIID